MHNDDIDKDGTESTANTSSDIDRQTVSNIEMLVATPLQ